MGRHINLSQCMIVKNEEKNIERALSWGKAIVREQIVVDTGSTDRTVELAEKAGAKVIQFQWIDDFSAAKNFALEQATGDWIAFLDADEYFTEEETKKIMPLLQEVDGMKNIDVIDMSIGNFDSKGKLGLVTTQQRFFRNKKSLRFKYRIHEELYNQKGKPLGFYDARNVAMILHTGYMQDSIEDKQKFERNIRMLELSLQDNPGDPMLLVYLGDTYLINGDRKTATEYYRQVFDGKDISARNDAAYLKSAFRIMEELSDRSDTSGEPELYQICNRLNEEGYGNHPDIDFLLGNWNMKKGDYHKGGMLLESALSKMEDYRGKDDLRITGMLEQVMLWIAVANFENKHLQNPQKAVQYASTVLRMNKYSEVALLILLTFLQQEPGEAESAKGTIGFLEKIYDFSQLKDLICMYKVANQVEFEAVRAYVYGFLPEEVQEKFGG